MVLSRITTHDQHHIGVLDVDPSVGHCAASECGPQTGDRRTVSNPGLRFEIADPQAAHGFYGEKIQFIGVGASADPTDRLETVDRITILILFDKRLIPSLLNPSGDFAGRIVPANVSPLSRAWSAHLWFEQATIVDDLLLQRRAFRTERPTIDRVIRISLDVDHLWNHIFGFVTKSMNDYPAANGTVGTSTTCLCGTGNL